MNESKQITRKELVESLRKNLPYLRFLLTEDDGQNTKVFMQDDTPIFQKDQTWTNSEGMVFHPVEILLERESFPSILSCMSAMEAGAYAFWKCQKLKWEVTKDNMLAVLTNFEID